MTYTAKFDGKTVRVYNGEKLFGSIDFSKERMAHADIFIYTDRFHVGPESATEKDIVVTKADLPVFKFNFDKLWGGAEIEANGEPTGYEVKGKWFKPGTRLVNENDEDLVVIKNDNAITLKGFDLEVNDEDIEPVMIMSTLYYHIYASNAANPTFMMSNLFWK